MFVSPGGGSVSPPSYPRADPRNETLDEKHLNFGLAKLKRVARRTAPFWDAIRCHGAPPRPAQPGDQLRGI